MCVLFSCQSQNSSNGIAMDKEFVEQFENEPLIDSLAKRVTIYGDTSAYKRMESIYGLSGHLKDFCYYAMIMANNFEYNVAYYDLYAILASSSKIQTKIDKFANYYLLKAYEKGNPDAKLEFPSRFGQDTTVMSSKEYFKTIE